MIYWRVLCLACVFHLLFLTHQEHLAQAEQTNNADSNRPGQDLDENKRKFDRKHFEEFKKKSELVEKQRDFEIIKSDLKRWTMLVLGAQLALGRFGYGAGPFTGVEDHQTLKAVQKFQIHSGLTPSGNLDSGTVEKIFKDLETVEKRSVKLPGYFFLDDDWSSHVTAKGTWMLENHPQGYPFHTSEIHCFRQRNTCVEAQAVYAKHHSLTVHTDLYQIERWDDDEIVTIPNDSSICMRYVMRISRVQEAVFKTRSTRWTEGLCDKVQTADLLLQLGDGFQVYQKMRKRYTEERNGILQIPQSLSDSLATSKANTMSNKKGE